MSKRYPHVYLDLSIGTKPAGRVIFELFTDLTPKTAENFRGLCTGEYGNVGMGTKTKKLHYLNCTFHRIIDGFVIQGGDIINGDGTGGASIYGPTFADENFTRKHACAGLLSMANRGRNTNSSQFFVTLKPCPHLDGKHVVFGQVIEGMETIRKVSKVAVDMNDRPKIPVVIVDCGEVNDFRNFLRYDPFQKALNETKQIKGGEASKEKEIETTKLKPQASEEQHEEEEEDALENTSELPISAKLKPEQLDRVMQLRMKINEARNLNNKAVIDEEKRMSDPNYEQRLKKEEWDQKKKEREEEFKLKGIDPDKWYMNETAAHMEERESKKKKKHETFGWEVFNDESLYRAYKKRLKNVPHYKDLYEQQKANPDAEFEPNEERLQNLVDDMEKQAEKRKKFSRRRTFNEDDDINYINDRNKVFNRKLERSFGAYAAGIKLNLERGTAE